MKFLTLNRIHAEGTGRAGRRPAMFGGSPNIWSHHPFASRMVAGKLERRCFRRAAENCTRAACAPHSSAWIRLKARLRIPLLCSRRRKEAEICQNQRNRIRLSMNLPAVTPTFQSARLAGWKTGATTSTGSWGRCSNSSTGGVLLTSAATLFGRAPGLFRDFFVPEGRGETSLAFQRQTVAECRFGAKTVHC